MAARPDKASYLASAAVLADAQGNFTAYLPDSVGCRGQHPDPRRDPPLPGRRRAPVPGGHRPPCAPSSTSTSAPEVGRRPAGADRSRVRPAARDRAAGRPAVRGRSGRGPAGRSGRATACALGVVESSAARSLGELRRAAARGRRGDGRGHRLAGEVPDHGAQLGLAVEAEPVVDAPQATVGRRAGRARSCGRRCWPRRRTRRWPASASSWPPWSKRVK